MEVPTNSPEEPYFIGKFHLDKRKQESGTAVPILTCKRRNIPLTAYPGTWKGSGKEPERDKALPDILSRIIRQKSFTLTDIYGSKETESDCELTGRFLPDEKLRTQRNEVKNIMK